eukprot:Sdes_comp9645_c0_seq2m1138
MLKMSKVALGFLLYFISICLVEASFSIVEPKLSIVPISATSEKFSAIPYPAGLNSQLSVDESQKITISFSLQKTSTKALFSPQQVFLSFQSSSSKKQVYFVAEAQSSGKYSATIKPADSQKSFENESGVYSLVLFVGDASDSTPLQFNIGSIYIQFSNPPKKSYQYQPKPEIHHVFRQPEKRP